ncbi:MAG: AAA family ATPase [Actinomycetota bacterium]|nr:AAA family ATPase [Actinomycetota bacterium]
MTKVAINQLKTGVPGLDEVLCGGLPEFSFNLIAGPPGSGKTTMAHQMMFALAEPGRTALYLSVMGEPPLKMLRYQQQFSFFDAAQVNKSVRFVSLTSEAASGELGQVLGRIATEVQAHEPSLVFVDSFRSVVLSSQSDSNQHLQLFLQQLGTLMTSWQATTFVIGEYSGEADPSPVLAVADGIIWLRQSVQRNSMVRKLEVIKMRGRSCLPGLHTFRIDEHGLKIFPPAGWAGLSNWEAPAATAPRVSIGVPRLDEMLGGGLPRGYSVLIAGPSGSGKTILASAFLAEGAKQGETGVVVVFEQDPNRSRNRVIAQLVDSGRVSLVDSRSPDLSIDEIVLEILSEIRRLKATRVVIDSLSGFELSVAPTFQPDFRESLARMVGALARTGVTVLMTSELEDRYTDLRFSPYGTAFLTDVIIVQRYIELDSRLQRMTAVVKVRASPHSDELRLFSIDDDGIRVGGMIPDQEGLLGGRPNRIHRQKSAII